MIGPFVRLQDLSKFVSNYAAHLPTPVSLPLKTYSGLWILISVDTPSSLYECEDVLKHIKYTIYCILQQKHWPGKHGNNLKYLIFLSVRF